MGQDSSPACTATSPSAPTDVTSPGQPPVSSWRSVDQGGPAPRAAIREVPTAGVLGMVRLCAGASASGRKLLVSSKPVCPKKEGRESSNMGERENLVSSCVLPPPYSSSSSSVPPIRYNRQPRPRKTNTAKGLARVSMPATALQHRTLQPAHTLQVHTHRTPPFDDPPGTCPAHTLRLAVARSQTTGPRRKWTYNLLWSGPPSRLLIFFPTQL